jgi:hypothetical protein
MSSINEFQGYSPVSTGFAPQGASALQGRDYSGALLQESGRVEQLSPQQIKDLQSFYNSTLNNIDSIRYQNIPQVMPQGSSGAGGSGLEGMVAYNDISTGQEDKKSVNPPLDPGTTSTKVKDAVSNYEKQTGAKVYDDRLWMTKHGTAANIAQYLYFEEGTSATDAVGKLPPLRSGHEKELYYKVKEYIRTNDIKDPNKKITPDMIMKWSLEVNNSNGKVCIQEALLTAHNVMRALARPDAAQPQNLKDGDPVKDIFNDMNSKNGGIHKLLKEKYGQTYVECGKGQDLFDPENKFACFRALTDDKNTSAGSSYHFWVGAFGTMAIDPVTADGMVYGEGKIIKKNNNIAQDEMPWGYAGVNAFKDRWYQRQHIF